MKINEKFNKTDHVDITSYSIIEDIQNSTLNVTLINDDCFVVQTPGLIYL